jgi:putative FmdB family regulatory protein
MPLYEYQCESCNHRFEVIQKYSDPLVTVCPKCGGEVRKLLSSPAIQFKGSGFYITDYARAGKSEGEGGSKGAKGEKGEKGEKSDKGDKTSGADKQAPSGESKGETKAETKAGSKDTAKSESKSEKPTSSKSGSD